MIWITCKKNIKLTVSSVSKLNTCYLSIYVIPFIITDRSPLSINTHFHSTLTLVCTSFQSYGSSTAPIRETLVGFTTVYANMCTSTQMQSTFGEREWVIKMIGFFKMQSLRNGADCMNVNRKNYTVQKNLSSKLSQHIFSPPFFSSITKPTLSSRIHC